jgi:hypothetical protein
MSGYGDACDHGFDITSVVEEWRERCPTFFIHPVAFVQDADPSGDQCSDERRGVVDYGS